MIGCYAMGGLYDSKIYPKLAEYSPGVESTFKQAKLLHGQNNNDFMLDFTEADGYQVLLFGHYPGSGSIYYLHVAYSRDWFETYTSYKFSNNVNGSKNGFGACVRYIDNTWIIITHVKTSSSSTAYVYTSSSITTNSWTLRNGSGRMGSIWVYEIYDIWKDDDGKYYIACNGGPNSSNWLGYTYILSASSIGAASTSWTATQITT